MQMHHTNTHRHKNTTTKINFLKAKLSKVYNLPEKLNCYSITLILFLILTNVN